MEITIKHVQELGNTVIAVGKRVDSLEKDSAFITDSLMENEDHLQKMIQGSEEEIALMKEHIEFIKTTLRNARINLDILIKKLKDTTRTNELERIQERVDQWNPEGLITKYELNQTLKEL
jgi:hypothetical protein